MKYIVILLLLLSFNINASCRSSSVKHRFDISQGYPKGHKGYIVDHICALKCGGLDIIENMQYQTISESKIKDRTETTPEGCKRDCNPSNSLPNRTVFNCRK